jgi:hypothetical protein
MASGIKHKCPHVLGVPKLFHVVVSAALSGSLVRIHRFRQNLGTLAFDPMPRRTHGDGQQNRQHQREGPSGPE